LNNYYLNSLKVLKVLLGFVPAAPV